MTNKSQKPAAVLDDSPYAVAPIARGLRSITGVDVAHYFSIPAFERAHQFDSLSGEEYLRACAGALREYSVLVCDNNFREQPDMIHPNDGYPEGIDFLEYTVAPALDLLSPEERPLVVCYSPSSMESIRLHRKGLEQHGIISFLKTQDDVCVGVYAAIVGKYGYMPTYQEFVTKIFGFTESEMDRGQKGHELFFDIAFDYDIYHVWEGEARDDVAGPAKPVSWGAILKNISHKLGLKKEEFEGRIESVRVQHVDEGKPAAYRK